ncbi:MAG: FKBP-type peptidyl-prolyl cis-trans isomerase [Balneola sp.]
MNFKELLFVPAVLSLLILSCSSSENNYAPESSLNTMPDSVSYVVGFQNGNQIANQGFADIDIENFLAGFNDGLNKEGSELADANLQDLFRRFGTYLTDKIKVENSEEAKAFFAENRTKEGVMETASGLQYEIIEEGTGVQPTAQDSVVVHYEGTLIDGTTFDASYGGPPAEFLLGGVIPGWIEGVSLMKEGATYMFYIPSELAYGENPRPGGAIQPNDALIFKIELLKVK